MEAVATLHTTPGLVLVAGLALLALAAAVPAVRARAPARSLDLVRRALLVVVVIEAALGLVLALRGSGPAEWIHWLYGALIILALLLPTGEWGDRTPRSRSVALAAGSLLAAIVAWRLWSSG